MIPGPGSPSLEILVTHPALWLCRCSESHRLIPWHDASPPCQSECLPEVDLNLLLSCHVSIIRAFNCLNVRFLDVGSNLCYTGPLWSQRWLVRSLEPQQDLLCWALCDIIYKKKIKMNKYQVWGNKSQITTYNISLQKQINRHEFVAVHGFNSCLLTILQVISPLLKNLFSNPWALTQSVTNTGAFRCVQEWYVSDAPSAH